MSTPALLQTYSSPPSLLCPRSQQLQELSGLHDIQEALILQRHIYCISIAINSNVLTCDTQIITSHASQCSANLHDAWMYLLHQLHGLLHMAKIYFAPYGMTTFQKGHCLSCPDHLQQC